MTTSRRMRRLVLVHGLCGSVLVTCSEASSPEPETDLIASIHRIATEAVNGSQPGVSVAVARDGELLGAKG